MSLLSSASPAELPEGYTLRPPTGDDIPAIIALVHDCDEALKPDAASVLTPADIQSEWLSLDLARDTWVVLEPDGALVGYELVSDQGFGVIGMDGYVHPQHMGRGIGSALVGLAERRADELIANAPDGARVILHAGVMPEDSSACQMLEERGYTTIRTYWRMRIDMAEPPPAPQWPEGITHRTFQPGRDERAVFKAVEEAFADHWGHVPRVYEEWSARFQRPDFDPSLVWLAFADPEADRRGTELVGVAFCRQNPDQGWVNTLAVRRPWRRHGLGMALLLQAFGEFYRRGERQVGLGVDAQSLTGATRLYEAAGMRPIMTISTYFKELRPGIDMSVQKLAE